MLDLKFQHSVTSCVMKNLRSVLSVLFIATISSLLLFATGHSYAAGGTNTSLKGLMLAGSADMPSGLPGTAGAPGTPSTLTPFDFQKKQDMLQQGGNRPDSGKLPADQPALEGASVPSVTEEPSDFERYLSEGLDINETQLFILKLQPDIRFSMTPVTPIPPGYTMLNIPSELGGGCYIYSTGRYACWSCGECEGTCNI